MVAREKAIRRRILVPVPLHLVKPPARTVATFASHLLAKRQPRAAAAVGVATPDAGLLNEICRCRGPKGAFGRQMRRESQPRGPPGTSLSPIYRRCGPRLRAG